MRVAIVTETFLPQVNGITRMLLAYLTYLEKHGHSAVVFAPGDGERRCHGFEIVRVNGAPFPLYPELILAPYSMKMGPRLRAWRPDIVHLAGPFVLGLHGLHVARALGVPVAAHYQTDLGRYAQHFGLGAFAGMARRRLVEIHNACDVTFAPTPAVAAELRDRGICNVHVSGRGVDATLFHPARRDPALRAQFTGGRDRPVILYVGRLSLEKNVAVLVEVARALPMFPLVVAGDGPARGMLQAALAGHDVHFTGMLHGHELAATYASSDVFLFPSATETFGQVVREAMAAGLPPIGIHAGGVQDIIRDGETGLLCPSGDEAALIGAVRRLAGDAALRATMGAAARHDAAGHTWDAVFDRLTGWYAGLVNPEPVTAAVGAPGYASNGGRVTSMVRGTADLHMHTQYSDGTPTVRALLDHVAMRTTLDVIAITDHDTIVGAREADQIMCGEGYPFELIVGEEVSTREGHLVGLFLQERIRPGLSAHDTVTAIHKQGGLAFAPHPFFRAQQVAGPPITMLGLGALVCDLDLDAIETINATPFLGQANRRAARFNTALTRLPAVGASDAHILAAIGKGFTTFPGKTALDLRAAMCSGQTAAGARVYTAGELLTYLRFWLRLHGRSVPLRRAAA